MYNDGSSLKGDTNGGVCIVNIWILDKVYVHIHIFFQEQDACGNIGLNWIKTCIVALCILLYRNTHDVVDDHCRMVERTTICEGCEGKTWDLIFEKAYIKWYWKAFQNQWGSRFPMFVCKFWLHVLWMGKLSNCLVMEIFKIKWQQVHHF